MNSMENTESMENDMNIYYNISEPEIKIQKSELQIIFNYLYRLHSNTRTLISLFIPSDTNHFLYQKILADEYSNAVNIENRDERLKVCNTIKLTREILTKYKQTPPNGLIILCGIIDNTSIQIFFQPFQPIHDNIYERDFVFRCMILDKLIQACNI
jgi:peptide subunit release factor 1 (eRF1)